MGQLDKVPIDIDRDVTVLFVTEVQYTRGSLYRQVWFNREDYERTVKFLVHRAAIDHLEGYEVRVSTDWNHIDEWFKTEGAAHEPSQAV